MASTEKELRERIVELTKEYHLLTRSDRAFRPGADYIPVTAKVMDEEDRALLTEASLDLWLTAGRFADQFEEEFARWMGARYALLTNSGSSANLLAVSALTSPLLGERRLRPGDEVITVAAGFPTTLNPILQNGLVPVFVDVDIPTYNIDTALLAQARSDKTKAIVIAHTLGNPFRLDEVKAFADQHGLWLVEDTCDAVGAMFGERKVGSVGDLATVSFYPAHHITMGEGGAVLTSSPLLKRSVESFRDWGRDCWCPPGKDNTCGKRFGWKLGTLPEGYDHKYTYRHIGYNLKVTDMQAALGVSQLRKLPEFIARRRANFAALRGGLEGLADVLELPEPTPGSAPSWFGFPITVRGGGPKRRNELVGELEQRKIGTRLLFGGHLLHQPAYQDIPRRIAGPLERTERIMNDTFWIGVHPALTPDMVDYMIASLYAMYGRKG